MPRWSHVRRQGLLLVGGACVALAASSRAAAQRTARTNAALAAQLVPGVSRALAEARRAAIDSVRYELALQLPADREARITGRNRIAFRLRTVAPVVLDFDAAPSQVLEVRANGRTLGVLEPQVGHLVVPETALRVGKNDVEVSFIAGDVPLNRNEDFLYTVFVPARARQAIPVFDQPDLKAAFALTLELPTAWQAVANGQELRREVRGDRAVVQFAETKPLPTYLFAFAAGRFAVDSAVRNGRQFRMFHRERDSTKVARNRDEIVDLHAQSLAWMERYTGIPYPWGKFDIFLAPAFQFGGMEHAGAIFYNASGLMLDAAATQAQRLGRASVIAHETAHLWFGDLVTMRWFDDVWLKEVFANFFAAKIVNPAFPEVNHELRFFLAHYPAAYDVDRTAGANPIRQPLENLADAGSLYGAIIYQKAPIVMRQLERITGEATFRSAMQAYLRRYAFGNATWPQLVDILDAATPDDLREWSRAWVSAPGRPTIRSRVVRDGLQGRAMVELRQTDPRGRGLVWPQTGMLSIIGDTDSTRRTTVTLGRTPTRIQVRAAGEGTAVLPNGGGLLYGDIELDSVSRAVLVRGLAEIPDPLTRGAALVTLWEEMLDGRIEAAVLYGTLTRALAVESNELLVQRELGYLETLWWRWLPARVRATESANLEALLRRRLARATTPSTRMPWFRTLTRVATTSATLGWLGRVWSRADSVAGLPLAEDDESSLALQLALREVAGVEAMLVAQQERITNADRKARFAFVVPSVSADRATRERFFASLAVPENRRREPWVLEGLSLLHHPLRAAASEPLVAPALEMLPEIQRTGDIFLPKRWLDALLGGHASPAVTETVRSYLAAHPELAPRLVAIVLQSADELFRVSEAGRR
jgi:aminopeptidase N